MLLVRFRYSHCWVSAVYATLELLSFGPVLGAIWVWDLWYKPPWLTNISSRCFTALLAKRYTFNSYEWTAGSSLHMTPELEQWTWLLCRVSVSLANIRSLQGLNPTNRNETSDFAFSRNFCLSVPISKGEMPVLPPLADAHVPGPCVAQFKASWGR